MTETTKSYTEQFASQWKKAVADQMGRMETFEQEMSALRQKRFDRVNQNMEEAASLWKEGVRYQNELAGEFTKLSMEAMRRSMDLLVNPMGVFDKK